MRYKQLVQQHVDDIRAGQLIAGQRMPSLRQFCTQYKVSMSTALNCYRALERDGWIIAQPQSGFYVQGAKGAAVAPRQPQFVGRVASNASLKRVASELEFNPNTGPFGISQLGPSCSATIELQRSFKRGLKHWGEQLHAYPDEQGFRPLREALASHFGFSGFAFDTDELVLTGGCIDAVRMALLVCTKRGDRVAVSSPCFSGLLQLLAQLERRVVEIPCNVDGIDLDQLEQLLAEGKLQAGLFSSSHMNPQGTSLSVPQKQRLAQLANCYKVPMIEDDVYAELAFDQKMPLPAKHWDSGGYMLWCGSVSKSLAAGIRVGWCLPGRQLDAYKSGYHIGNLGLSAPMQWGLADYIQSGNYARHLSKVRSRLLQNTRCYREELLRLLPPGAAVSQPSGGMVLWVQVAALDSELLSRDARALGIDLRAGASFTTRRLYRDCFRLNAGWALDEPFDDERTAHQALQHLARLIEDQQRNSGVPVWP